jgi:hypothetical protein
VLSFGLNSHFSIRYTENRESQNLITLTEPTEIALRSCNLIKVGRPEVVNLGRFRSGSISLRDLNGFPAIFFWIANWLAFRYLMTHRLP